MSKETSEWLNTMVLVGFTSKRGTAWHYRLEDQGGESNHYADAVPVEDVLRRLFDFEVEERPLFIQQGKAHVEIPGRKAMVCTDNGDVLGIFKEGYQGHQYKDWLLDNVSTILDDSLSIGSAGLLRNRGQAWVSVEVPENITTPEGVEFRPNLIACTSFDGSLATTYKRMVTAVVCDNTLAAGLGEDGQSFKLKHSRYSNLKLTDAREALAVVHTMAADFAAEVARLTSWKVTQKQFQSLLTATIPVPADKGRGQTIAMSKQGQIKALYASDIRCAPWQGTAFGVLQAFNTYAHHYASVRKGTPRYLRNMENVLTDKLANQDADLLTALAAV